MLSIDGEALRKIGSYFLLPICGSEQNLGNWDKESRLLSSKGSR